MFSVFYVFLEYENICIETQLLDIFLCVIEIFPEIYFYVIMVMAALICVFLKMLKDARWHHLVSESRDILDHKNALVILCPQISCMLMYAVAAC